MTEEILIKNLNEQKRKKSCNIWTWVVVILIISLLVFLNVYFSAYYL